MGYILENAEIINEGRRFRGWMRISEPFIEAIGEGPLPSDALREGYTRLDVDGRWVLPGFIDDQVHFREPGLTHKGDLYTEPKAAVAGGITSFMEMPNTRPSATTQSLLEEKYALAAEKSLANYSFYIGASNTNLDELLKTDPEWVCGVKIFMGSSTGDLLVDDPKALEDLFREVKLLIASHCEDDPLIKANLAAARARYGDHIPVSEHPHIRSAEACYRSSAFAVEMATKYDTRFHILHISTARELDLFRNDISLAEKRITSEACVHHLWFSDADYATQGAFIKWNPSVKRAEDREAIREAVRNGKIDVLATDHAPHTFEEKQQAYGGSPSGGPLVQDALPALFELCRQGVFTPELVVQKYAHNVAEMFQIDRRGFLRPGYYADVVVVHPNALYEVKNAHALSKCGWSPFDGVSFHSKVERTFVNGFLVYDKGTFNEQNRGMRMRFNR